MERRQSGKSAERVPRRTKARVRRTKSLTTEQALENAINDLKSRRRSQDSRHMRPDDDGSYHSARGAGDGSDKSLDDDDFIMKIVAERSRAPEPPESGDSPNSSSRNNSRSREEQIAAAMRFNQNGQAASKDVPEGLDGPGAYKGAPGKDYELVETALAKDASRARQMLENMDEEAATSSVFGSTVDDNSEAGETVATAPRGSAYLKHLEVGRGMKGLMALAGTLLLVIPLIFAGQNNEKNTEAAKADKTNAPAPVEKELTKDQLEKILTLHTFLPNETLATIEQDSSSPQAKAYQWLLEDPWLGWAEEWVIRQRMAMATFYYAFGGDRSWDPEDPQTSDWLTYNTSVCSWMPKTQYMCHDNLTVARIHLGSLEGFRGTMPGEISLLLWLEEIHFNNLELFNRPLSALLHPNMAQLTALKSFECIHCDLDIVEQEGVSKRGSPLPTTIGEYLPNLMNLDLSSSHLSGSIPSEVGLLTRLTSLKLETNKLSSSIPSEMGNLSLLNFLWLRNNNLTEEIPNILWEHCTNLWDLDMNRNKLEGTLSTKIGLLTSLRRLDLKGGNEFIGTLPSELGLLTSLTGLYLGGNNFKGTLPQDLQRLTNMDAFGLNGNELSGEIPWFQVVSYWTQLSQLHLEENDLEGSLPPFAIGRLSNHAKLHTINIGHNQLDGSLPSELGLLSSLTSLELQDNNFQGTLPTQLGQLTQLNTLDVSGNSDLLGPVPREICEVDDFDFSKSEFDWCQSRGDCCVWL